MAQLCLTNSELIVAETLSDEVLKNLISSSSALLYPSLAWLPQTPAATSANIKQLIVIDASWRKSKKILHLNPALQTLPRLHLSGGLTSNYTLRKSVMEDGLSTIESIVAGMQLLEPNNDFDALLQPFERMIALQQSHKP